MTTRITRVRVLVEYDSGSALDLDLTPDQIMSVEYSAPRHVVEVSCDEYGCDGCGFVHRKFGPTQALNLSVVMPSGVKLSRLSEPAVLTPQAAPKLADVVGVINWERSHDADQQARTIITIMSVELDALRMRVSELERER